MPDRPFPEIVLALTMGRTRAAAIYGDLVELAGTRNRAWFWLTYARTLISLTWRTTLAFLAGCMAFDLLGSSLQLLDGLTHNATHAAFNFGFAFIAFPLAFSALILASMVLAFSAAVRYGLQDRLALLASAMFLMNLLVFIVDSSRFTIFLPVVILGGALCLTNFRRAAVVYMITVLIGTAAFASLLMPIASNSTSLKEHLVIAVCTLIIMAACSRLRRRMRLNTSDKTLA